MAKQKCCAKVGSMSINLEFSPIKQCTKYAAVVETHTWKKVTYVNAYCERHRTNVKHVSPSVKFKVEAI